MAVRVTETCRVAYDGGVVDLTEGDVLAAGEFADYLAATGAPVEPTEPEADDLAPTSRPAGNASGEAWRAYVLLLGATDEQIKGRGRDQLRELATELESGQDQGDPEGQDGTAAGDAD